MAGYTRQEVFNDGDVILAEHGNNELNKVESAFSQPSGHKHDGTAGEGAYVPLISNPSNTNSVAVIAGGARTTGDHDVTGNITVAGTVDGRDVAADGTKLDGVETGATADQTGAEIKTAYEAEADTNAFTDALLTKLNGVEAGATADQTGAEIKAAYEAEADTNAFTDALLTKLNGVEAGATADQTGAEIKTAYEAEANTNAFTDALLSKLNGVEAGATKNPRKNLLANGVPVVRQRGETFTKTLDVGPYYLYDRWFGSQTGAGVDDESWSVVSDTTSEGRTTLWVNVNQGPTSGGKSRYCQILDADDTYQLRGQQATVSLQIKAGQATSATYDLYLIYDTNSSLSSSLATSSQMEVNGTTAVSLLSQSFSTSAQKVSMTGTIPASAQRVMVVVLVSNSTPNSDFRFTEIQLEKGSASTEFDYRPVAEELALCQRYFEKTYTAGEAPGSTNIAGNLRTNSDGTASGAVQIAWQFKVGKRVVPTVTAYKPGAADTLGSLDRNGTSVAAAVQDVGTTGAMFINSATTTDQALHRVHGVADAEL